MAPEPDPVAALRAEVAALRAQLERAERTIALLQVRDRVTGLYDARETLRLVRLEIDRCRRYQRVFSLLVVEVLDADAALDRLGREGADELLVRVARACGSGRRSVDLVGRVDAARFAVVLPETPPAGAWIVADHVRRCSESDTAPIEHRSGSRIPFAARLAFGVASFPGEAADADGLLALARRGLAPR